MSDTQTCRIEADGLTLGYGERVIQRNVSFRAQAGQIVAIMGPSGCGKSTLMKAMLGLLRPMEGDIRYNGESFVRADPRKRDSMLENIGATFQGGALWSSMTLLENASLPLEEKARMPREDAARIARLKLAMVGLKGFEEYYPSEISGGMRKRAGLARAMALDPHTLFFDEPSAGLDPINSRRLDELILQLRDSLGATVVIVTHELPSIFAIADEAVYLDPETRSMLAVGPPKELLESPPHPKIASFLRREA